MADLPVEIHEAGLMLVMRTCPVPRMRSRPRSTGLAGRKWRARSPVTTHCSSPARSRLAPAHQAPPPAAGRGRTRAEARARVRAGGPRSPTAGSMPRDPHAPARDDPTVKSGVVTEPGGARPVRIGQDHHSCRSQWQRNPQASRSDRSLPHKPPFDSHTSTSRPNTPRTSASLARTCRSVGRRTASRRRGDAGFDTPRGPDYHSPPVRNFRCAGWRVAAWSSFLIHDRSIPSAMRHLNAGSDHRENQQAHLPVTRTVSRSFARSSTRWNERQAARGRPAHPRRQGAQRPVGERRVRGRQERAGIRRGTDPDARGPDQERSDHRQNTDRPRPDRLDRRGGKPRRQGELSPSSAPPRRGPERGPDLERVARRVRPPRARRRARRSWSASRPATSPTRSSRSARGGPAPRGTRQSRSEVQGGAPRRHWPEDLGKQLAAHADGPQVINDSKTPSGTVHVGSLRGPVILDVIARALRTAGIETTVPLRRRRHGSDGLAGAPDARRDRARDGSPAGPRPGSRRRLPPEATPATSRVSSSTRSPASGSAPTATTG